MYKYNNTLFAYNLTDICVKIIFIIKVNVLFLLNILEKARN